MADATAVVTPTTEQKKQMAAISAVINPLTTGLAESKIFLFTAEAERDYTVSFEQRVLGKSGKGADVRIWKRESESDAAPPKISLPSTLVALYHDLCLHVYGILDDGTRSICLLSPVYERQPAVADTGKIAGCPNGEKATLFYEVKTANNTSALVYKDLPDEADGHQPVYNTNFYSGTYLGAANDGENSWVAYQRLNKTIALTNVNEKQAYDVCTDTKWFRTNTPLALLFIPKSQWATSVETSRGRLVVYWLDDEEAIQRCWGEVRENGTISFSKPGECGGKRYYANSFGQMSVLYDPKGKKNVIHCQRQGANKNAGVQIYTDPWTTL